MFRAEIKPSQHAGKTCFVLGGVTFEVDNGYNIAKGLGYGSHGVLCLAEHTASDERVAIEKVENVFDDVEDARVLAKELLLLTQLRHPNVLSLKSVMPPAPADTFSDLYVVYELMAQDMREKSKSLQMTIRLARVFVYELLCGLQFLHSAGITHADVRPKHLLINDECSVKVGHFAVSFAGQGSASDIVPRLDQPLWYCAPELLAQGPAVGTAIDMWSTGCILAELIARRPAFKGNTAGGILSRICRPADAVPPRSLEPDAAAATGQLAALISGKQQPDYSPLVTERCPDCPAPALDLLQQLLRVDPKARITAAQALQHPWFANIREAEAEQPAAGPATLPPASALESPASLRQLFLQLSKAQPAAAQPSA